MPLSREDAAVTTPCFVSSDAEGRTQPAKQLERTPCVGAIEFLDDVLI